MTCQVNFHLYHYGGNNPVRYTDPDGRVIFMVGWTSNAGCGTGVAENLGVYLQIDREETVSVGMYSTSSVGAFFGISASTGVEITIAPFADDFSDIAGYSLSAGGSGPLGMISFGGEVGYNPTAKTPKDKIESLTLAISGTVGKGLNVEGHIYNNFTAKLSEYQISDKNKANEIQENVINLYSNNDYESLSEYILTITEDVQYE